MIYFYYAMIARLYKQYKAMDEKVNKGMDSFLIREYIQITKNISQNTIHKQFR